MGEIDETSWSGKKRWVIRRSLELLALFFQPNIDFSII